MFDSPHISAAASPASPLLSVSGLTVFYGNIRALHGISFDVMESEIVALIGANGAGKSTTLRAISGLVPHKGDVVFGGRNLRRVRPENITGMGLVQAPEGRCIFHNLSVLENLKLATWQRRDNPQITRDYERVFGCFPRLAERRHQPGGTLSGGEQQMLAIGRALMSRPRMLLLDEPSMGLAPVMVTEIFRVITEIHRDGTSILLVEQNANMALRHASRALVLETGLITHRGTGAELLGNPLVREAYLGG
ncbi:MAG: ABC transporter ATP-binding protein [bacterium]|nr:ABC transporter ATP-binding protein [Candidatus Sumerlaeota bacterium]